MKTCRTCQHATTRKVWYLFELAYCGHPASAHPVTGEPTIPCATAREGHSCEACRPSHCGIDARLHRAPDAPQRPRWLPDEAPLNVRALSDAVHGVKR
jgi:hypothetical protein